MNILAIDPGTKTGWASLSKRHIESGVHDFQLGRGDSPGMRFLRFRNWLADMLTMTAPDLVVYERPLLKFGYSAEVLAGFTTRIQEACAERRIECEAVHGPTLKKFTCGTGRADKAQMVVAATKRFGKKVHDDNEADALNLLWLAMQENRQTPPDQPGEKSKS